MKYEKIVEGVFVERPNRFIAKVIVNGQEETVHVKNTGRCRELLPQGAKVYLADEEGKMRKTRYDLVAAVKEDRIINMDSQAPNAVVKEALQQGLILRDIIRIKPEFTYGDSRFDFFVEIEGNPKGAFIEVKGVTLEKDGVALFPDAPTLRGVKHIRELIACKQEGFDTCILFVVQMKGVHLFQPNVKTQPEFWDALAEAKAAGVKIAAYDCLVTFDGLQMDQPVEVEI